MSDAAVPLKLDDWLAALRTQPGLAGLDVDSATQRALLDLSRIAAHRSERIAAPISAYLAGLAAGRLPEAERAVWLGRLVAALETESG